MFDTTDCDHVFILDCDEFLDVENRAALETLIVQLRDPLDVGQFFWKNCVPSRLDGRFVHDGLVWVPEQTSVFGKVFVSRQFYDASLGRPILSAGNHFAVAPDGTAAKHVTLGHILHVPVRSAAQLSRKAIVGSLNNFLRLDRNENEAFHWREIVSQIATKGLTEDDLTTIAAYYGLQDSTSHASLADLPHSGFTQRKINGGCAAAIPSHDEWRMIAAVIAAWRPLDGGAITLELQGTRLGLKP
jgi:hypothetical protein